MYGPRPSIVSAAWEEYVDPDSRYELHQYKLGNFVVAKVNLDPGLDPPVSISVYPFDNEANNPIAYSDDLDRAKRIVEDMQRKTI